MSVRAIEIDLEAARWLPAAAVVICALAWVIVEGVRSEFSVKRCICQHKIGEHDMTYLGSARVGRQSFGECAKCLCRAFIQA